MRLTKVITLLNKRQVRFCKILKTTSSVLDDHNITHYSNINNGYGGNDLSWSICW